MHIYALFDNIILYSAKILGSHDNFTIKQHMCSQTDACTYITSDIDDYDLISHGLDLCHAS